MHWIVHVSVVLLNILWVAFFLQPDPFTVFVQRRSSSSYDEETLFGEFCIQPPSDMMSAPGPVSVSAGKTKNTMLDAHTEPNNRSDIRLSTLAAASEPTTTASAVSDLHESPPAPEQTLTSSEVTSASDLVSSIRAKADPVSTTKRPKAPVRQADQQDQGLRRHVSLGPENCCFTYYQRKLNKKVIDSYEVTDHRCAKPGVILTVAKSRRICVDPSLSWVEDIMKDLDNERST
ncbi:uncharacterized protein LOC103360120 [Stegastes partitus]|uniref:C-C motif chemokine n=1 Tax=Stegastes partitus TaxID=144197 RepID=A0A9Y4K432_9TELE|nr:PREDICTED: uncharacterized protein LOC103360120 [Stegastes partitus]